MRWSALAACFLGLAALAGCFNPTVKDGGFACSDNDNTPCPSGYKCVNALCTKNPGQPGASGDMAMSVAADLALSPGGDLASSMPKDMAQASGDMATPPMCSKTLALCMNNSDCCSMMCVSIFGVLVCA